MCGGYFFFGLVLYCSHWGGGRGRGRVGVGGGKVGRVGSVECDRIRWGGGDLSLVSY